VGFDDIPTARFARPALTTITQDTTRAGQLLVETLMQLVRDEPATGTILPVSLVVRRSSDPA
jgi:DNA-binding LacI/PurR family transcriptional regulator